MNTTQSLARAAQPVRPLQQTVQFAGALLRANLRNVKALALTLGMPLFMLFTIWAPSLAGDAESQELMRLLFPAIILLSVIMPGLTQATRLTRWREQRILQRFALAPLPLANLVVATALTQIAIGVAQGVLMMVFGVFIVGLDLSLQSVFLVLGAMALAGAAFVGFGSLIAAFSRKADLAGYVFFFTIMPLTFLASFPPGMLPEALNWFTPWLPASMALELIGPLFLDGGLGDGALLAAAGLVAYTALFAAISAGKLRWQD